MVLWLGELRIPLLFSCHFVRLALLRSFLLPPACLKSRKYIFTVGCGFRVEGLDLPC